jgi:hypothetical protein
LIFCKCRVSLEGTVGVECRVLASQAHNFMREKTNNVGMRPKFLNNSINFGSLITYNRMAVFSDLQ